MKSRIFEKLFKYTSTSLPDVQTEQFQQTHPCNKPQKLQLLKIKVLNNFDFFFYHYRYQYAVSYLPILDTSKGFKKTLFNFYSPTRNLTTVDKRKQFKDEFFNFYSINLVDVFNKNFMKSVIPYSL